MHEPRGFLKYSREVPARRPADLRKQDWKEFYLPISEDQLRKQGARCMDCGVPFCQSGTGCPVENRIPDWNSLVQQGRWREALESLHATNNFPEFTGRLCPAPCESACVLGISDAPVTIRVIESSIVDRGFAEGWIRPQPSALKTGKSVGIVGSGPAGLAAAQQLARLGHDVTVYEKADRPGGLLRYGIPEFKMEKSLVDRRIAQLQAEGVDFRCGVEIGSAISLAELRAKHGAIGLAVGAEQPRDLPIAGRGHSGVVFAMDYLVHANRVLAGLEGQKPEFDAHGKRVVILGGGDTGSDCLGTAHRQGCREVTQIEIMPEPPRERSAETPWPLWPIQLRHSHAHEEGGTRQFNLTTTHFSGEAGRVTRLHAEDRSGSGKTFEWEADLVILALGFSGVRLPTALEPEGLRPGVRGALVSERDYSIKELPGVFVAGDARRGASLIVWAIAEGRKMATSVHRYLK